MTVIVQLAGGLGNQLFQYAAGRAVALRLQRPLELDLSMVKLDPQRSYALGSLSLDVPIASSSKVRSLTGRGTTLLDRLSDRFFGGLLRRCYPTRPCRLIVENTPLGYDPSIFEPVDQDIYLVGHWQNFNYFLNYAEQLRNEFSPRMPLDQTNRRIIDEIGETEAVSLHVRRGDYVHNPQAREFHGLCTADYYAKAIQVMMDAIGKPTFFVFSDEIDWVRENLPLPSSARFVNHNGGRGAFLDIWLMRHCRHHIIANSTFSWWGAWLNPHSEKLVVAPKQWFGLDEYDTTGLLPDDWIRL